MCQWGTGWKKPIKFLLSRYDSNMGVQLELKCSPIGKISFRTGAPNVHLTGAGEMVSSGVGWHKLTLASWPVG